MQIASRLRHLRAAGIIEEELKKRHCPPDSSSAPAHSAPNEISRVKKWWLKNVDAAERADTDRSIALLNAYDRIAHGDDPALTPNPMFADGLRLNSAKTIWMDRSVMARFLRDEFIEFKYDGSPKAQFSLTEKGQERINWR